MSRAALLDTARAAWPASSVSVTRSPLLPRSGLDLLILPGLRSPRWLVPTDAPVVASALADPDSGRARRLLARAVGLGLRTGVARRLPLARLRITPSVGSAEPLAEGLLATIRHDVAGAEAIAIRLGAWSHARSFVVRVYDARGGTVAFGKVGIDEVGQQSVRDEAAALALLPSLSLQRIGYSTVLGSRRWRDLELLWVSPLLASASAPASPPPVDAMLELARATGSQHHQIADSAWLTDLRERIEQVTDPVTRGTLLTCLHRLVAASVRLELGPWHGDWTRWNMVVDGGRVLLWDWEHFRPEAPVGFDLVHFLAQDLRVSAGTGPDAEREWLDRSTAELARHLRLGPEQVSVLLVGYLLDLNVRFVLDRQGTASSGQTRAGWGLPLLAREAARLPA